MVPVSVAVKYKFTKAVNDAADITEQPPKEKSKPKRKLKTVKRTPVPTLRTTETPPTNPSLGTRGGTYFHHSPA